MKLQLAALAFALTLACNNDRDCEPIVDLADELCLPPTTRANQTLTFEARHGCGGCEVGFDSCSVTLSGDTLTVSLGGQLCPLPNDVACAAVCAITDLSCPVPALPAGTYRVVGIRDAQPRTLTVTASATTTRCDLGAP